MSRRKTPAPAAAHAGPRGRTGPLAAGLLLAVLALFMSPMSIRELSTSFNRRDFVQDELQLDDFREGTGGDSSAWLEGHIASTGERYRTDRVHVVGLDRLREMRRRRALEGTRVSVWYLPKRGAWAAVDELVQFRVRSPEEFVQELPAGLIALNAAVALASVLLIRRGVGFPREAAT